MATETEKQIQSIKIELTSLKASLENLRVETTPLRELASQVQNLKLVASSLTAEVEPLREITKKVAVIEHQLAEMTKTKELRGANGDGWSRRSVCRPGSRLLRSCWEAC